MKPLDIILYEAIVADDALMQIIGGRVRGTCFEIPPTEQDNTPIPNIIVTDDGFQEQSWTKDDLWDSLSDRVQATVDIAANNPAEVKDIATKVRRAVNNRIAQMCNIGESIPTLQALTSDGIAWDWLKPCYFTKLVYTADVGAEVNP